jgi:NADPH:quinone reductase-like Zn-dependent oxidoreductase
MEAVVCTKYGSPEVLQLREVEKPVPKDNEVCVKIFATAATASDCIVRGFKFPRWHPMGIMMGAVVGFRAPRNPILGMVLSGEVESVGEDATRFKEGDQVFGSTLSAGNNISVRFGSYAQYMCLPEDSLIAPKPAKLTHEEAAAIPYGFGLAMYYVKIAEIQPGEKVLIYGASGAIGTTAVQLAKHYGAEVTGVCSSGNFDMVGSLGADKLIDYRKEDSPPNGELYDFVFDAVGKKKDSKLKAACREALTPDGRYQSVDSGSPSNNLQELDFLNGLIEAGELRAVIDRSYPLEEIVEAHRYVDEGHKKGNVVIRVTHTR